MNDTPTKKIAVIGGGPSALFMYKNLLGSGEKDLEITIFEAKGHLGQGMPYSSVGANSEHVTNVSDTEIPELVTSMSEWVFDAPQQLLEKFGIVPEKFNEYKVVPRRLFGAYLEAQFQLLIKRGEEAGIKTTVMLNTHISDIAFRKEQGKVLVRTDADITSLFDYAIIATGHSWPKTHEGKVDGYFDSPYPPSKLDFRANHAVALKGASLTAIDALRTLARANGEFTEGENGKLSYRRSAESPEFRFVLHSRNGLLPAVRFHLEESLLSTESILSPEEIAANREENGGFLSLDYVFEKNFKELFREKDPEMYESIREMSMEEFVAAMMNLRENVDPFVLLKLEYEEAQKSIRRRESILWKEFLAILSFAMNYPAKYFSAEDRLRLQKELMPLVAVVIAFIPQSSCRELMALYEAGLLEMVTAGNDSDVRITDNGGIVYEYGESAGNQSVAYKTFVDCTGQPHLSFDDFPFESLRKDEIICPAKIMFRNGEAAVKLQEDGNTKVHTNEAGNYYLSVPGITINDHFQVVDKFGVYNEHIYIMAVPYIGGYNPDYSGLDFSEASSVRIAERIFREV